MPAVQERSHALVDAPDANTVSRKDELLQKLTCLMDERNRVREKLVHDLDELEKVDARLAQSLRRGL